MSKKLKTFDIRQEFDAGLIKWIYRGFPKFRGYWKIFELIARVMPKASMVVQGKISLDQRSFIVPVDLRDPYQIDIFAKNKKELCVPAVLAALVGPGGFYLDVGANCGWYCRFMSEVVGDTGLVVALEPGRRAFPYLTKLTYSNLMPLRYAATAVNGQALIEDPAITHQWENYRNSSGPKITYGAGEGVVIGRSLDHLLGEFRRLPDAIKIDVEGAELDVLRGASQILRSVSSVIIEVNTEESCQRCGYAFGEIYDFMAKHGFFHRYDIRNSDDTVYQLDECERIPGDILFTRTAFAP